jgi:transcriptional regulator with XRE-family HTH domain
LTQAALAERAGVSVATIGALEEDRRRRPYPNTVAVLAEALGLSAEERSALQAACRFAATYLSCPRNGINR